MSPLVHFIYASSAVRRPDAEELRAILDVSRRNNRRLGVTGMLLQVDLSFFQVLEGPPDAVAALYATIAADPRHRRVTKIIDEPIARRSFGDWSMAFPAALDPHAVPGFDDCLGAGHCVDRIGPGRARKLVEAFTAGRWRQRLSDVAPVAEAGVV